MIELTSEQAVFLALLIGFISPVFQALKRLAALPYVASGLAWLYSKLEWVPGSSDDWQRVALYGLATIVASLFQIPIVPALPGAAAFTLPFATELLTWGMSVLMAVSGFIGLVTLIYNYFYKNLYKAAGKADIPVLKELSPVAIQKAEDKNS